MKPIVATGLSLAGVLGAGALAAVANMQVLDGPEDTTPVASAAQPAAVDAPVGGGGNGDTTDAVGVQTFQVGSAGTITLDASGGLHLVDSDPAPGWRAEQEDAPSGEVIVTFEAEGDGDLTATAAARGRRHPRHRRRRSRGGGAQRRRLGTGRVGPRSRRGRRHCRRRLRAS